VYQISSESPKFYRRYYKKIVLVFFSGHPVHSSDKPRQLLQLHCHYDIICVIIITVIIPDLFLIIIYIPNSAHLKNS